VVPSKARIGEPLCRVRVGDAKLAREGQVR